VLTAKEINMRMTDVQKTVSQDSLERCDLGVNTAAFAAFGEMAALRDEGVTDPLVLA